MNIRKVKFGRKEIPKSITVQMSLAEALFMAEVTGKQGSNSARAEFGVIGDASQTIYGGLVGAFFNVYWEDGVADARKEFLTGVKP